MSNRHYWSQVLQQRMSRRTALAASGAGATALAFAVACGGSDKKGGGGGEPASSIVTVMTDETKTVKKGGVWKQRQSLDPPTMEPHTLINSGQYVGYVYATPLRIADGHMKPESGEILPEAFESWEISPDKLTLTAKVNRNNAFAPQAPVNGRGVEADDFMFSAERIKTVGSRRGEFFNEFSPSGVIKSMEAPDSKTLVFKLAFPYAPLLALLASTGPGSFYVAPKEARDPSVMDLRRQAIGSGAHYIVDQKPSVGWTHKRNPGFKQDKNGAPFYDAIEWTILPEYASALAQFRAGNFYTFPAMRTEDILPLKKEVPEMEVRTTPFQNTDGRLLFGQQASPFTDERVRQAMMLSLDRELLLDAIRSVSDYRAEGIPIETSYEASLAKWNTWGEWFLSPQSKEFGPNAKFFKKDLTEAKRLMQAAGYNSAADIAFNSATPGPDYIGGPTLMRMTEVIIGFLQDSNLFKVDRKLWRQTAEFQPMFQSGKGQFSGVAISSSGFQPPEPMATIAQAYHPGGGLFQNTDAKMTELIDKGLREFDDKKRMEICFECQRYEGEKFFTPRVASANGLALMWPVVRNFNVWQSTVPYRVGHMYWIDPDRAPLKKT